MFLAGLSLVELLALLAGVSAITVALYLLDRSRRKVVVSTLRFWSSSDRPMESTQRRKIRQWTSLLLQLVSMALLLLALAQLRWGSREDESQDHVLVLDTSSWMAAREGDGLLIDAAKELAQAYVEALPSNDRVMVVYADGLPSPATSFEANRRVIESAIRKARPGASALSLRQAIEFAVQAQRVSARRPGEIVYAGAGRVEEGQGMPAATPPNFRVLPVAARKENTGLRKVGLRRLTADPEVWQVLALVRNYGERRQAVEVALLFGGAPVAARRLELSAGVEREVGFELRTQAAGLLELRLRAGEDAFPDDDAAILELPSLRKLSVAVCSAEPGALRVLIESHPLVSGRFFPPEKCDAGAGTDLLLLDGIAPPAPEAGTVVYFDVPSQRSPVAVRRIVHDVRLESWRTNHPLGAGLRTRDLRLKSASALAPAASDDVVASSEGEAFVVARESGEGRKLAVFGFHPMKSAMRYTLAAPLLFANLLYWTAPEIVRGSEIYAGTAGAIEVDLGAQPERVTVMDERNQPVPFSVEGEKLRFFSGRRGQVRVVADRAERVYSLTLPEVASSLWEAPETARRGVPAPREGMIPWTELWPWLAALGAAGLWLEWTLFAERRRFRVFRIRRGAAKTPRPLRRAS